ncbi:hypothetical protein UB32_07945 [Mesobacillus subterraneus]|uniref:Type I restriction modification DNA specificity domain-containing protein n=2 Tax=Mesobacillus subterraneus TaxID=285983 RepID=A0A0D6ZD86_9BACI|nr:hypothetical protein UB32_07945 [Mesobacillus subterraneus]
MNSFLLDGKHNNWSIIKLKHLLRKRNEKDKPELELLSVYRDYGVIPKSSRDDNHNRESLDLSNYRVVYKNDLVMNKMKGWQGSLAISRFNGIVSPAYIVCDVDESKVIPQYLHHILRSRKYIDVYKALSYGIRTDQWELHFEDFQELEVALPPRELQIKIARFIDEKVSRIHSLSDELRKKVEILKQYRSAIITTAVTKGHDPNVSMKDSKIEWLGTVPENWEVSQLGYFAEVKARIGWKGLKADEYVEDGYIFLATPNIKNREIDYVNVNFITKERYLESPEIMLNEGDVLLAKDGSTLGTVNIIRKLPKEGTVNSSIAIVRPHKEIHSLFLRYYFESNYMKHLIQAFKDGMGVPHLFQKDIKKFKIVLPPINEQIEISNFIDDKIEKIDTAMSLINQQIQKLDEYRSSLITEAVTGQIDVLKMSI